MLRFGPFEVDERTWTLNHHGTAVDLSPRLVELLGYLAMRPGVIVTKDELLDRFWPGVSISDNTLTRAVADIRKALGDQADSPQFVQTLARRGYRFVASLESPDPGSRLVQGAAEGRQDSDEDPFQAWVKGRLALDSLDLTRLAGAVAAFERAVLALPSYAPAHAGLANAYLLQFERTRSGSVPDRQLLARAIAAARQACVVDPSLGEGWAALGYLLAAAGKSEEAQAAARRGAALEPDNWRHHYRLAHTTWGEERLRAVDRILTLLPGFAPARMLSAMVFIARGAIDRAEREATLGADAQRQHRLDRTPLPAVGLHWLRGLVLASRGETTGALASFAEEIATGASVHVYAPEFAVNARVATGFVQLNLGDAPAAAAAFRAAIQEAPGHPRATLGLYAAVLQTAGAREAQEHQAATDYAIAELRRGERLVEAALVAAGERLVSDRPQEAADLLDRLITEAPAGPAGWIMPADPMLSPLRSSPRWPTLMAKLAARAA
ncbi:MAG: transcriptional regulator [Vicinamibacterales bacterium]